MNYLKYPTEADTQFSKNGSRRQHWWNAAKDDVDVD